MKDVNVHCRFALGMYRKSATSWAFAAIATPLGRLTA